MDALADLIRSQLESGDRARFASVKRLAVIAQKLMMELAPSAADAEQDADFALGDDFAMGPIVRNRNVIGGLRAGDDQQQMVREVMAAIGPVVGGQQRLNVAKRRESMARELNDLLDARGRLSMPVPGIREFADDAAIRSLTRRIDAILAEVATDEQTEGDEDGLHVVPAVDVRRHQAGQGIPVDDDVDPQRPFADGEAGDEGAVHAGD